MHVSQFDYAELELRVLGRGPYTSRAALNWYRGLSPNQRIALREVCVDLLGIPFTSLRCVFSLTEIITVFHDKLLNEGILA